MKKAGRRDLAWATVREPVYGCEAWVTMTADSTNTVAAVHRLKEKIDRLTEEQAEALKSATYLGMTPEEAQQYDERRKNITELVQQLALLEKAQ